MEVERLNHEYIEGSGTPIIFIHGWLGSKEDWQKVRHHLDLENPMLFYDQRCHGESGCEEFDFMDLAEDLHELIEHYEIEKPILAGHSMGGMVALTYFAAGGPVSGLLLSGTSASTPEPENGSPRYFLENLDKIDRREWAREIVENYVGSKKTKSGEMAYKEIIAADKEPIVYGLKSMIRYDIREDITFPKVEALVLSGKEDDAITKRKSEELASLLDCDIVELDSSHLMTFERPEEVAEKLSNFVSHLDQ